MSPRAGVVAQLVERIRVLQNRVRVLERGTQDLLDELEVYRSLAEVTEEVDCKRFAVETAASGELPQSTGNGFQSPLSAFQRAALDAVRGAR